MTGSDFQNDALEYRVVSQPHHGTVGLVQGVATYIPEPGFVGDDVFTFSAWDGSTDSNLGVVTIAVVQGTFSMTARTRVPPVYTAGWPVPFGIDLVPFNVRASPQINWDFGDGTATAQTANTTHVYNAGSYQWKVTALLENNGVQVSTNFIGTITIEPTPVLTASTGGSSVVFTWPALSPASLIEETASVGGGNWTVTTNVVSAGPTSYSIEVMPTGQKYYGLPNV
jgi:hypothetical protein